ncbi:rubredoxin-like domain-containing protein [Petroclostridium sp. X23]|uniref:rubredoxin-like domain-containing protein n=1 Tax=Petroclostridium sp. X23 TaxID=3045146 RepID=UPI0024AE1B4E|nr:rubredoxin [Petroclostridium sp. X23]WHH57048.1 rubredoxin [Petroclostridium sp. X23]
MKKLFKCSVCGYVHEGEEAPAICPKCGAPKEKFVELGKEDTDKIYASDRTNDIHMDIILLARKIAQLCEEGIKLNLDPACVSTFEKAKDEAWIIKQRSKAEIEGHMKKGKW